VQCGSPSRRPVAQAAQRGRRAERGSTAAVQPLGPTLRQRRWSRARRVSRWCARQRYAPGGARRCNALWFSGGPPAAGAALIFVRQVRAGRRAAAPFARLAHTSAPHLPRSVVRLPPKFSSVAGTLAEHHHTVCCPRARRRFVTAHCHISVVLLARVFHVARAGTGGDAGTSAANRGAGLHRRMDCLLRAATSGAASWRSGAVCGCCSLCVGSVHSCVGCALRAAAGAAAGAGAGCSAAGAQAGCVEWAARGRLARVLRLPGGCCCGRCTQRCARTARARRHSPCACEQLRHGAGQRLEPARKL